MAEARPISTDDRPPTPARFVPRPRAGVFTTREHVLAAAGDDAVAVVDAFALTLLGVDDVAVYDGSLLEWTADPALPMATDGS